VLPVLPNHRSCQTFFPSVSHDCSPSLISGLYDTRKPRNSNRSRLPGLQAAAPSETDGLATNRPLPRAETIRFRICVCQILNWPPRHGSDTLSACSTRVVYEVCSHEN
jgi:hypothetical protein